MTEPANHIDVKRAYMAWRLKNKDTHSNWDFAPGSEFDRWLNNIKKAAQQTGYYLGYSEGFEAGHEAAKLHQTIEQLEKEEN